MTKNGKKELTELTGKDEKKKNKKRFDSWSYWLAWGGFAAVLLSAIVKLIKATETPKKDEFYL